MSAGNAVATSAPPPGAAAAPVSSAGTAGQQPWAARQAEQQADFAAKPAVLAATQGLVQAAHVAEPAAKPIAAAPTHYEHQATKQAEPAAKSAALTAAREVDQPAAAPAAPAGIPPKQFLAIVDGNRHSGWEYLVAMKVTQQVTEMEACKRKRLLVVCGACLHECSLVAETHFALCRALLL